MSEERDRLDAEVATQRKELQATGAAMEQERSLRERDAVALSEATGEAHRSVGRLGG